jgi:hypothetical protein
MPGVAPGDRAVTACPSPALAPSAVGDLEASASARAGQPSASSPADLVIRFSICQA